MSAGVEAGCVCILFVSVRGLHLSVTSHKTRAEKITYLHKISPPRNFTNLNQEQLASWVFQSYQKQNKTKTNQQKRSYELIKHNNERHNPFTWVIHKDGHQILGGVGGTHGHHLISTDVRCGMGRKQTIESLSGFPVQHDLRA